MSEIQIDVDIFAFNVNLLVCMNFRSIIKNIPIYV